MSSQPAHGSSPDRPLAPVQLLDSARAKREKSEPPRRRWYRILHWWAVAFLMVWTPPALTALLYGEQLRELLVDIDANQPSPTSWLLGLPDGVWFAGLAIGLILTLTTLVWKRSQRAEGGHAMLLAASLAGVSLALAQFMPLFDLLDKIK